MNVESRKQIVKAVQRAVRIAYFEPFHGSQPTK